MNKGISDISCDEKVFNNAKLTCEKALHNSGLSDTFSYIKYSDQTINNRVENFYLKYGERAFQSLTFCQKCLIKIQ